MDKFIAFGNNKRIKASNIKDYGISSKMKFFGYVYEYKSKDKNDLKVSDAVFGAEYWVKTERAVEISEEKYKAALSGDTPVFEIVPVEEYDGKSMVAYRDEKIVICEAFNQSSNGLLGLIFNIEPSSRTYCSEDVFSKKVRYLYVTTYQNDNFQFFENEVSFNLNKKLSEIDSILL